MSLEWSFLLTFRAAFVFVIAILVDIVWGLYIRRSAAGQAVQAATFAALIMLLGVINVLSYLQHTVLIVPIIIGNWIGTFTIVKWDHRRGKNVEGEKSSS